MASLRELETESGKDLAEIRLVGLEILQQIEQQIDARKTNSKKKQKKRKKSKSKKKSSTIFNSLHDRYDKTGNRATECAIVYLLKNGCQIDKDSKNEEILEHYALRRRKKEIEIEDLQKQLRSRLPTGRDLQHEFCNLALEAIEHKYAPEDNTEARLLQDNLSRKSAVVPYPIFYGSNTDLTWIEDKEENLSVKFNGLVNRQFEIRCDTRQIHWFRRFLEDQQLKKQSKQDKKKGLRESEISSALFGLRSGRILWRERKYFYKRKKNIASAFQLLFLHRDYELALFVLRSGMKIERQLRQKPWKYHSLVSTEH